MTQDEIGRLAGAVAEHLATDDRLAAAVAGRLESSDKLADAIYQKLKTNAFSQLATKADVENMATKADLSELGGHFDNLAAEVKGVGKGLEHVSTVLNNWQGAE